MGSEFASKSREPALRNSSPSPRRTGVSLAPPNPVLQFQSAIGNQAVLHSLKSPKIQRNCVCGGACPRCRAASMKTQQDEIRQILHGPQMNTKLAIGEPGDKYEQEADRVAEQVMRMPEPQVQRQVEQEEEKEENPVQNKPIFGQLTPFVQRQVGEESEEEILQTKNAPGQTPDVTPEIAANNNAMRGGGTLLPESERRFFESRFGSDFRQVRVHSDSTAAENSQALSARAFTTGRDIAFGAGQYLPNSSSGRRLLAHELTHVIQQGAVSRRPAVPSPVVLHTPAGLRDVMLQRQTEFRKRSFQQRVEIPESYPDFREIIERWLSSLVMSRTTVERAGRAVPIQREVELVATSNLRGLHRRLTFEGWVGEERNIRATLIAGANNYERVEFSTPGLIMLDPIEEEEGAVPTAADTLDWIQRQARPEYRFSTGEPSLNYNNYVLSKYFHYDANIDMRHFLFFGDFGESLGALFEFLQAFSLNEGQRRSANDPQDFYSNTMGVQFFSDYYSPGGRLSTQLESFFAAIETGHFRFQLPIQDRPSAGVPTGPPILSQAVQDRLIAYAAQPPAQFVEFVRTLETWIEQNRDPR